MTYFVTNNCMDIAGVVENPDIAAEMMRYSEIRNETLNRCYAMENFKNLSTVERPSCGNDRPCLMMAGQKNMENSKGGKSYEYSEF